MPAPLPEGERIARVLRDKRIRRSVLDREIAALEDMARVYEETAQLETVIRATPRAAEGH